MTKATELPSEPTEQVDDLLPFRGGSFGAEHLDAHFRSLAENQIVATKSNVNSGSFIPQFESNARGIVEAYGIVSKAARAGEELPAEAEWLLDNYYVVDEQLREIRDDLPRGYYQELPKTTAGHPRVYELARELVVHTDSSIDADLIERCVQTFQSVSPFSIGEVWAVPIMLRLVLVENLHRLCAQMLLTHTCRRSATEMLATWKAQRRLDLELCETPQCIPTVTQLLEQLPYQGPEFRDALSLLERRLADGGWQLPEVIRQEHQRLAANQVSIGNVITSMRLIASLDWIDFFERVNCAEQVLRTDPAGVYSEMHFESRNQYRHVVEELAKRTKKSDIAIAHAVINLARENFASSIDGQRRQHVGYWLINEGRSSLERKVGYRTSFVKSLRRSMLGHPYIYYFGALGLLTAAGALGLAFVLQGHAPLGVVLLILLLWLIPISEIALNLTNLFVTNVVPPRLLPRFDFKSGVPRRFPTMVVVPAMLSDGREVASLLQRLESHFLSNSDRALSFALLTDFVDAAEEQTAKDAALLEQAVAGIRQLNDRYRAEGHEPFYLFHRQRKFNANENRWMGWERKRGKLMEFGQLLHGSKGTTYATQVGDLLALERFRDEDFIPFIITLDSDTQLPHDTARKLIGTLAHPLNRPQFADDQILDRIPLHKRHKRELAKATVKSGYTILQPRVSVQLESAGKTRFSKLYSSNPGVDPYVTAASDVYQDLFGEGSFTGKGIYDLRAFERALADAFPENTVLSHDLVEGCHARVGLVSNIEVFDGQPSRFEADARRTHRWVRGDWQLIPWLLPYVPTANGRIRNPLSWLSWWKIADNLRRSLNAPALLIAVVAGWFFLPALSGWWTGLALLFALLPVIVQALLSIRNRPSKIGVFDYLRSVSTNLGKTAAQSFLALTILPFRALSMSDAVVRTLWRVCVSRKHMLEWETAAAVDKRIHASTWRSLTDFWILPTLAIALAATLPASALPFAAGLLVLWLIAPAIISFLNRPLPLDRSTLDVNQKERLRRFVSETWSFFEAYVTAADNWLPVDNVQEEPNEKVARRLSPTNEGLFLVSTLIAHDFGFASTQRVLELLERNLESLDRLEKLNGHLFNWYDTETLQPLNPRYVSTVDSGNLVACLLTLHSGILELLDEPFELDRYRKGVSDSLGLLIQACDAVTSEDPIELRRYAQQLRAASQLVATEYANAQLGWDDCARATPALRDFVNFLATSSFADSPKRSSNDHYKRLRQKTRLVHERLAGILREFDELYAWVPQVLQLSRPELASQPAAPHSTSHSTLTASALQAMLRPMSLRELARLEANSKLPDGLPAELAQALTASAQAATTTLRRLTRIAGRVEAMALKMDFRFLYNSERKLFSIGFNIEEGQLDRSHYDMLCSESRLASYLAIAKGDVEANHWFRLGRHATLAAGQYSLLSWGGTMFEYLMPPLFQRHFDGSILTQSCRTAIAKQAEYGRLHKVPWGISESAYGALAINSDYHYRSFGVPGLGLKRGLAKDLVVSPYSTMMALPIDPAAAFANLLSLIKEGALGHWGFYEAIDYTSERVPINKRRLVVRCYMAHHQGMSLLALANVLNNQCIQRRFNLHPMARAAELLLQERVPATIIPFEPQADESELLQTVPEEQQLTSRRLIGFESPSPRTHLLSNGKYSVMLSSVGSGFSRSGGLDVTRWRADTTADNWGQYIYLRDLNTQRVWSATYQPTCVTPDEYEVIFAIDKVDFHRRQGDLETLLEVAVSPENDAEIRQLRIINHGDQTRRIEITSYAEVSLAKPAADLAHPAFQKLFVETEFIEEDATLFARRRPRDSQQRAEWALHVLAVTPDAVSNIRHETSRQAFLGRRHSVRSPQYLEGHRDVDGSTGTTGAVLDPIFSLSCEVELAPGASVTLAYTTAVAEDRQEALALADQYHELRNVQRVFELAWAYAQVELRHQHLTPGQVHLYQRLASYLLYPHWSLRGDAERIKQNRLGQSGLWRHGISGDVPIMLAHVNEPEQLAFVRDLALAQRFWRERGFATDLVLINDYPGSYFDALQDQIISLLREIFRSPEHPSVYLLRGSQLPLDEVALFETVAACVLHGDQGTVLQQIESAQARALALAQTAESLPAHLPVAASIVSSPLSNAQASSPQSDLEFWNGTGGFANDGREYHIRVVADRLPPMPWSQVVANKRLGFLVTESGGGFTWFENSRENKLTVWSNDPVCDPPSELLYLRDSDSGETWLPYTCLRRSSKSSKSNHDVADDCWAKYAAGSAVFEKQDSSWSQRVQLSVAETDPVKFIRFELTNRSQRSRNISVSYFADLVLGVTREQSHWYLQSAIDTDNHALLFRNPFHPEYSDQVVFIKSLDATSTYTADRADFLGRNGTWEQPAGLREKTLSGRTGVGFDPCAALQVNASLAAGETRVFTFLLGAGRDEAEALELLNKYQTQATVDQSIDAALSSWQTTLQHVQVKTPNRALDILVNHWLLYQVLCCRMWGRSAFYQSGGAFGFRDQLQDSMALVYARPELTREHLLLAASRQFIQGDVQHWWHPPLGKGTRTRFSDDLLWLPFATSHYIEVTRDVSVLDEVVSFLESPELREHEIERYEMPRVSNESATLYEHCVRAMNRAMQFGEHGLPLMGCGDWNDGMNKVGEGGKGESVWVGWFLLVLIKKFVPVMQQRGDNENLERFQTIATKLRDAMESEAWDGAWYRRAYFDDGTPLGSSENDECQIDSLTQSWAVFADANLGRARRAMSEAVDRLVQADAGLILLFTPPFDKGELDPGYIKGYLPGIRENGGQYTHAATWMIQALAQLGESDQAMHLLDLINPINHALSPAEVLRYQTEPYVVAADVYGVHPHEGRGGWTWYTGSAAWLYRVIVEHQLGLSITGDDAALTPSVPQDWQQFSVKLSEPDRTLDWTR